MEVFVRLRTNRLEDIGAVEGLDESGQPRGGRISDGRKIFHLPKSWLDLGRIEAKDVAEKLANFNRVQEDGDASIHRIATVERLEEIIGRAGAVQFASILHPFGQVMIHGGKKEESEHPLEKCGRADGLGRKNRGSSSILWRAPGTVGRFA